MDFKRKRDENTKAVISWRFYAERGVDYQNLFSSHQYASLRMLSHPSKKIKFLRHGMWKQLLNGDLMAVKESPRLMMMDKEKYAKLKKSSWWSQTSPRWFQTSSL
ncbi:hypothetical protein AVEN_158972-1 [Araneus ventricosus]|uniref:Uncharacterized protein n=1 Tax=Araneus ventricosus TaxID=182803 RepID=A0A4Y2BBY0_ARAVE|nr:hypothetical protein AVEN_158972-1 [Araneus ventricosus]